jgi:hypothetical protein
MQERLEYFLERFRDNIYEAFEELNLTRKRILEFVLMFFVLSIIYSTYLLDFMGLLDRDLSFLDKAPITSIIKFFFHIGWPFLILTLLDKEWSIRDTQKITLTAFFICTALWIHKYKLNACIGGSAMLFAPLFFSALLFHRLGAWRHRKPMS